MMTKSKILFLLLAFTALFSACTDEKNYYTTPLDSRKAAQVRSVGALFDNVARQPELTDQLVSHYKQIAGYNNFSELLPLAGADEQQQVGQARGEALATLFQSMARQPELYDTLDSLGEAFLGRADDLQSMSLLLDYSRYAAVDGYVEALARQPELQTQLEASCRKFLGITLYTPSASGAASASGR